MIPSPVNLSTVPPYRCTTAADLSNSAVMISRNRPSPTPGPMSIECTTSANITVTCLYSAGDGAALTGAPHSLQNLDVAVSSEPHDAQISAAVVMIDIVASLVARCGQNTSMSSEKSVLEADS